MNLLPASASAVGYRSQKYDMTGNQLKTSGTRAGVTVNSPGRGGIITDIPQSALQLLSNSTAGANNSNIYLRCLPDDVVKGGGYAPDPDFKRFMTTFINLLVGNNFGFVGRDLTQPTARVLGSNDTFGVIVDAVPAGLEINNWVRFNRVINSLGQAVIGPYKVTAIVGTTLTLAGFSNVIKGPSGTLRKDLLTYCPYQDAQIQGVTTKKVGAPSQRYHGRRSKKRVRAS